MMGVESVKVQTLTEVEERLTLTEVEKGQTLTKAEEGQSLAEVAKERNLAMAVEGRILTEAEGEEVRYMEAVQVGLQLILNSREILAIPK